MHQNMVNVGFLSLKYAEPVSGYIEIRSTHYRRLDTGQQASPHV